MAGTYLLMQTSAQALDLKIGPYDRHHPPTGTEFRPDPAPSAPNPHQVPLPEKFFGVTIQAPEFKSGGGGSREAPSSGGGGGGGFSAGAHPTYSNEGGPI